MQVPRAVLTVFICSGVLTACGATSARINEPAPVAFGTLSRAPEVAPIYRVGLAAFGSLAAQQWPAEHYEPGALLLQLEIDTARGQRALLDSAWAQQWQTEGLIGAYWPGILDEEHLAPSIRMAVGLTNLVALGPDRVRLSLLYSSLRTTAPDDVDDVGTGVCHLVLVRRHGQWRLSDVSWDGI